jgi:uncharacterized protein YecE (DUF72 family)
MAQLSLFPDGERPPQAARLGPRLRALAEQGVYFGTSSWKYEGWLGSIYDPERYRARGKFSPRRFQEECLAEYALTFPAVCGDFSFYQFPTASSWRKLFGGAPPGLRFGLKVPEEITAAVWPRHDRYGTRAGQANESFLSARLFADAFARPLGPYARRVAVLIFEFGTFAKSVFARPEAFLDRLDPFLGALPGGFRYAVEIRNPEYLGPDYFGVLAEHGVAHVFNAWTRMPEMGTQLMLPGSFTTDLIVARALLRAGRSYQDAVAMFQPYERAQETDPAARDALRHLADRGRRLGHPAFLFVNNRLEGNAPSTIEAVAEMLPIG